MSCHSDKRLKRLVRKALLAIEDPAKGIVFDDFDLRYREQERLRELKSAAWFYRDKTPFETKYGEDGDDEGNEPAWVSDNGQGAEAIWRDAENSADSSEQGRQKRLFAALAKAWRVSPALAKTLRLIVKNGKNRRESIWTLMKR